MERLEQLLEKYEKSSAKGQGKMASICKNAAQLFAKNSYEGTTLGDIAQATGISKAGIFHYFNKKEEILFWIIYQFLDTNFQILKSKLNACNSAHDKLYVCIKDTIENCKENQAEFRVSLVELESLSIEYQNVIKEKQRLYTSNLRSIIEKLIDRRSKDANSLTEITFCLLGMCSWSFTWFKPDGKVTTEELSSIIYRIFMGELRIVKSR